jgi:CDP-diacylglycerol---glycerol-3-phosphate 3-phosphatidyltransferase
MADLLHTIVLISVALIVTAAYMLRVYFRGRAQSDRIDRQGGSALLNKGVMEGFYWFVQPLGRVLISIGVTPNQISWMSLLLGAISGVCLAYGHFGSAAVFATVSAVMDSLDGLVARLTGVASDAGEVLDATADRYVEFFFLGGLAIYYREIPALLLLTLFALMGSFMVSYSTAKAEAMQVDPPKGNMRRPERALYLILGAALSPMTIPYFEADRIFGIPVGHPMVFAIGLVAVLSNLSALERLWAVAKSARVREAAALEARRRLAETELELIEAPEEAEEPVRPGR